MRKLRPFDLKVLEQLGPLSLRRRQFKAPYPGRKRDSERQVVSSYRKFRGGEQLQCGRVLAAALLDQDDRRGAADAALTAIVLKFELAAAHYILGVSLAGLGEASRAALSLETRLRFEPENRAVQARLSAIRKGVVPHDG